MQPNQSNGRRSGSNPCLCLDYRQPAVSMLQFIEKRLPISQKMRYYDTELKLVIPQNAARQFRQATSSELNTALTDKEEALRLHHLLYESTIPLQHTQ